ncbi:unnamed protein product [Moneuplotes crassus]|uniref:Kinesin motor domain-containing protein n=1 Tax=Euplotes crassus TaxID=5936 RepID=A0AAD1Y3V3_EUPCR|nr:unnamed protein product [Moneuplotes crassus]
MREQQRSQWITCNSKRLISIGITALRSKLIAICLKDIILVRIHLFFCSDFFIDDVFSESVTNKQVYNKFCKDLVLRVCDGYNGTIFAYGQTSSGKTHTMIGKKGDSVNLGVDSLAVQQLFDYAAENDSSKITVWVSYMEIYNEVINDLLDKDSTNLKIREDTSNSMGAYVEGLKSVQIQNYEEFMEVLDKGEKVRQYGQTKLSEKYTDVYSSRSHTIVRIMIQNKPNSANFVKGQDKNMHISYSVKYSILNLVDLAGSERLSDVGLGRTKETSHINTSLFVLSKVINCLAGKSKRYHIKLICSTHIPFRDSKLTQLLKNSLGGNSMTSVICTVSPNLAHLPLTVSTLEFAKRAKNIKVKARANEVIDDHDIVQNRVKAMEAMISKLERNIDQLNEEVSQHKQSNFDLKLQIRDYEDKMMMQEKKMTEDYKKQLKDVPQLQSIPAKVPDYISYSDIKDKCTKCDTEILNVLNLFKNSKEMINPSDSKRYCKRLDQIESFLKKHFIKCDGCQNDRTEVQCESKSVSTPQVQQCSTGCQTDESNHDDYMFFLNMIEGYLRQCLQNKEYKVVTKDYKIKDSQRFELYMDFFRAKVAIKNKIQTFIDRYEEAHTIKEEIEEYTIHVNECERQGKNTQNNPSLLKKKQGIVKLLTKWNAQKKAKEKDSKGQIMKTPNTLSTSIRGSLGSSQEIKSEEILNDSSYSSSTVKENSPSKALPRKDIIVRSSIKTRGQRSINLSTKRKDSVSNQSFKIKNTQVYSKKALGNLKSNENSFMNKRKIVQGLRPNQESSKLLKGDFKNFEVKEYSGSIPSPDIGKKREMSHPKAKLPVKLPSLENRPDKLIGNFMKNSDNDEFASTLCLQNSQDREINEDHLEDALIEELDDSCEDSDQDEQCFEYTIQRSEDHKIEIKESLKKRIKPNYVKKEYNTYMLGDNREGRCGTDQDSQFMKHPTKLKIPFKDIKLGYHHSSGISMEGIAYTWGSSSSGQLGQGEVINQRVPSLLALPLKKIKISGISCGWQHTLAVTASGYLYSWGQNINGQLGLGDFKDRNVPTLVEKSLSNPVDKVSAGHSHSAMIDNNSQLYTWGANPDSRLCKKTTYYKLSMKSKDVNKPARYKALENTRIVDVSCGHDHTLFCDDKGVVYASGDSSKGQLGDPYYHPEKAELPYFAHYFLANDEDRCIKVKAGDGFSVFLSLNGSVYTCGQGNYGRLGHENCVNLSKPAMIQYFKHKNVKIIDIDTCGRHTYAISNKKKLYAWGFGFYHQLPTSSREDQEEPTEISLPSKISSISCGYFHSAYILENSHVDLNNSY